MMPTVRGAGLAAALLLAGLLLAGLPVAKAYNARASEAAGRSRVGWATGRREESPSSPAQGGG
jgi:hypothetical protein